jgi:transcriptional regulator with XRE-family HTH domain
VLEIDPPDLDDWLRGVTAERLRRIKVGHGLTDEQIAERMGVSRMTFYRYKQGHQMPTFSATWQLLMSLGLRWDDVLPDPRAIQVAGR